MGEESTERAATADEISTMKKLVREAMDAGAIGFGLLWITLGILALANRVVRPDQAYVAGTAVQ